MKSDLHVDRSAQGFLTFTVGKTQFQGLCLLPLSRALSELSKYEIKKGVISFLGSPFKDRVRERVIYIQRCYANEKVGTFI